MRRALLAGLVLLAGCEKSFDDRYAAAEKKLREQAASIDKELAEKASEGAIASDPPLEGEGDQPKAGGGVSPSR